MVRDGSGRSNVRVGHSASFNQLAIRGEIKQKKFQASQLSSSKLVSAGGGSRTKQKMNFKSDFSSTQLSKVRA